MLSAFALGEFDPDQFVCGSGTGIFQCVGTDTDAIAQFFSMQRQINRLRAALARTGSNVATLPAIAVDGAIGTNTQTAASLLLSHPAVRAQLPTPVSLQAVVLTPSIENVATFSSELADYFARVADRLEALAITGSPTPRPGGLVPEDTRTASGGMSTGAKVAIGVVGGLVVLGGAIVWKRRR